MSYRCNGTQVCGCPACHPSGHNRRPRSDYRPVKTTNTSSYDEGSGNHFVMSSNTRRTFTDHGGAVEHATHLIRDGHADEFLIVKVVGRVRKKPIPVEYIPE